MATSSGWDPGRPPPILDGKATTPAWMSSTGVSQLQILQLRANDDGQELCPYMVGKSMHDLVGDIESTRTESNGKKYVLQVRDPKQVEKLLNMRQLLDDTVVTVDFHPVLNKRRCVISCREIVNKTEEELLQRMADNNVVGVKRITRKLDGKIINTPTLILTINGTAIPEHIKVGPLRIPTRIYIPDPMLCFKCFEYGHTKYRCKNEACCRNCSISHNQDTECNAATYCKNCNGQHGPSSRTCPVYATEKEITRLRFTKGISDEEARKQVAVGGGTYAAVSKVQPRLTKARESNTETAEMKAKDDLIKKLMDTITQLTARIDELEMKSKLKKEKKKTKRSKSKEEFSISDMDTDNSTIVAHNNTPTQVSATPKPISTAQKRQPTTQIQAPITKKTLSKIEILPNLPGTSSAQNNRKTPATLNNIIQQLHTTPETTRNVPPLITK